MKQTIIDFWKLGFQAFPLSVSFDAATGRKRLDWKPKWGQTLSLFLVLDWLSLLGEACNAVAIKTGQCSNLWVLDLDTAHGKNGIMVLERLDIAIPNGTVSVLTQSGGIHYYFRFPESFEHSTGANLFDKSSGIDSRGNGGFIIAPPSRVKDGGGYSWIVSPFKQSLSPLPEGLLNKIIALKNVPASPLKIITQSQGKRLFELSGPQKRLLMEDLEKCKQAKIGFRSHADFALCCWAVCIGLAEIDLWELCRDVGKFQERGRFYFDLTYNNAKIKNRQLPPALISNHK
jgi:hypothetical protein